MMDHKTTEGGPPHIRPVGVTDREAGADDHIALVIAGMHRSGTSALARTLSLLGCDLPKILVPASRGNDAGHWEPWPVVSLNDEILASAGSSWDDWEAIHPGWYGSLAKADFHQRALAVLAGEFGSSRLFVLKDPRICRLLPFWIEAIEAFGARPVIVCPIRHPIEVAASLEQRDAIDPSFAQLLWLRHVLEAEADSRGLTRAFLRYDELLGNWQAMPDQLGRSLGICWPRRSTAVDAEIERFLSRGHRHHTEQDASVFGNPRLSHWIRSTFAILDRWSRGQVDTKDQVELDQIKAAFDAAAPAFGRPVLAGRQAARANLTLTAELAAAREQLTTAGHELTVAREQLVAAGHELTVTRDQLAAAGHELNVTHEQLAVAREELATTGRELTIAREQLAATGEHLAITREQLATTGHELNVAREQLAATGEQLAVTREQLATTGEQVAAAREQLTAAHGQLAERDNALSQRGADLAESQAHVRELALALAHHVAWRLKMASRALTILSRLRWLFPDRQLHRFERSAQKRAERVRNLANWSLEPPSAEPAASGVAPPQPSCPPYTPRVTVVIPNFNHERFLQERLESIYSQTYANFDVLLLDDCSSDGSQNILNEFANRFPSKTARLYNQHNSGSPFSQWVTGIERAQGELVWIAESDDLCNRDFLERMVTAFADESVLLAYGDIQFISDDGKLIPGVSQYLATTGYTQWDTPYVKTAHDEFQGPFGVKNIIVNASGALFRKPLLPNEIRQQLASFGICGDWWFYQLVSRGGRIAYVPQAKAYFRQHTTNASGAPRRRESYYREHFDLTVELCKRYSIPPQVVTAQRQQLQALYDDSSHVHQGQFTLDDVYPLDAVLGQSKQYLSILIASLGFYTGGGEIFPIWLANALSRAGHSVTFFALGYDAPESAGVRAMLDPDIAVLRRDHFGAEPSATIAAFGFDVISTHNIGLEHFFLAEGCALAPAYIVTHHGSYEANDSLDRALLHRFDNLVDRWLYVAGKNRDLFVQTGCYSESKFTRVVNGIPSDLSPPAVLDEFDIDRGRSFVCLLASRAIPEKGWRHAINAVRRANSQSERKIVLLLAGDGPVYDELKRENLEPEIRLLGFRSDIGALYRACDCALLPSWFAGESFPLTLLQALQQGRPCIATDIGEVRNIISDSEDRVAGILVAAKLSDTIFEEDFSRALLKMANDTAYYAGACSIAQRIAGRYHIDQVARQYEGLFRETISEVASRRGMEHN